MLSGIIIIAFVWLTIIGIVSWMWTRYDVFIQDKDLSEKYAESYRQQQLLYQIYIVTSIMAMTLFFGFIGIVPAVLVILGAVGVVYYNFYLLFLEDGVKDSVLSDLKDPTNLWVSDAKTEDGSVKRWTIYSTILVYPLFLVAIAVAGLVLSGVLPLLMLF